MKAVGLREASRRCGFSYSTGRKKVADGTFPIPELPRSGREWHRYSEADIDRYLNAAATDEAASLRRVG
jgi:predicted DNA-binding transcriptional regulator AlpA